MSKPEPPPESFDDPLPSPPSPTALAAVSAAAHYQHTALPPPPSHAFLQHINARRTSATQHASPITTPSRGLSQPTSTSHTPHVMSPLTSPTRTSFSTTQHTLFSPSSQHTTFSPPSQSQQHTPLSPTQSQPHSTFSPPSQPSRPQPYGVFFPQSPPQSHHTLFSPQSQPHTQSHTVFSPTSHVQSHATFSPPHSQSQAYPQPFSPNGTHTQPYAQQAHPHAHPHVQPHAQPHVQPHAPARTQDDPNFFSQAHPQHDPFAPQSVTDPVTQHDPFAPPQSDPFPSQSSQQHAPAGNGNDVPVVDADALFGVETAAATSTTVVQETHAHAEPVPVSVVEPVHSPPPQQQPQPQPQPSTHSHPPALQPQPQAQSQAHGQEHGHEHASPPTQTQPPTHEHVSSHVQSHPHHVPHHEPLIESKTNGDDDILHATTDSTHHTMHDYYTTPHKQALLQALATPYDASSAASPASTTSPSKHKLRGYLLGLIKDQIQLTDDFSAVCRAKVREKDERIRQLQSEIATLRAQATSTSTSTSKDTSTPSRLNIDREIATRDAKILSLEHDILSWKQRYDQHVKKLEQVEKEKTDLQAQPKPSEPISCRGLMLSMLALLLVNFALIAYFRPSVMPYIISQFTSTSTSTSPPSCPTLDCSTCPQLPPASCPTQDELESCLSMCVQCDPCVCATNDCTDAVSQAIATTRQEMIPHTCTCPASDDPHTIFSDPSHDICIWSHALDVALTQHHICTYQLKSIQKQLQNMTSQQRMMEQKLTHTQMLYQVCQQQVEDMKGDGGTTTTTTTTSSDECTSLRQQYISLQQQYDDLTSQHTSLQTQVDDLQQQHTSLQAQYDDTHTQYTSLQQQHTELVQQQTSLQQQHTELLHQHTLLETDMETCQSYNREYEAIHTPLVTQNDAIKKDMEMISNQLKECQAKSIATTSTTSTTCIEDDAKAKLETCQQQQTATQTSLQTCQQQYKDVQEAIKTCQQTHETCIADKHKVQQQLAACRTEEQSHDDMHNSDARYMACVEEKQILLEQLEHACPTATTTLTSTTDTGKTISTSTTDIKDSFNHASTSATPENADKTSSTDTAHLHPISTDDTSDAHLSCLESQRSLLTELDTCLATIDTCHEQQHTLQQRYDELLQQSTHINATLEHLQQQYATQNTTLTSCQIALHQHAEIQKQLQHVTTELQTLRTREITLQTQLQQQQQQQSSSQRPTIGCLDTPHIRSIHDEMRHLASCMHDVNPMDYAYVRDIYARLQKCERAHDITRESARHHESIASQHQQAVETCQQQLATSTSTWEEERSIYEDKQRQATEDHQRWMNTMEVQKSKIVELEEALQKQIDDTTKACIQTPDTSIHSDDTTQTCQHDLEKLREEHSTLTQRVSEMEQQLHEQQQQQQQQQSKPDPTTSSSTEPSTSCESLERALSEETSSHATTTSLLATCTDRVSASHDEYTSLLTRTIHAEEKAIELQTSWEQLQQQYQQLMEKWNVYRQQMEHDVDVIKQQQQHTTMTTTSSQPIITLDAIMKWNQFQSLSWPHRLVIIAADIFLFQFIAFLPSSHRAYITLVLFASGYGTFYTYLQRWTLPFLLCICNTLLTGLFLCMPSAILRVRCKNGALMIA